jgi:hypothetical protein
MLGLDELARRLRLARADLIALHPIYHTFHIPKRSGGTRKLAAPEPGLKHVQRAILRRLLARLPSHPAAMGFERGKSVVENAGRHRGKAVVVRLDIRSFFDATRAAKVDDYLRRIGWDAEARGVLLKLTTHEGSLPQGAPTSPRLSNLVCYRLDFRLDRLARKLGGEYTRYADDLAFSFPADAGSRVRGLIRTVKTILRSEGYELHVKKKLHIRRRRDCQLVTGLVVNERVNLPRAVRRWLRSVEHHVATGRRASLTRAQLAGWRSYRAMVERRAGN